METVGVEAVVEGLTAFKSDIEGMNNSMKSMLPKGNALTTLFNTVTGALTGFGREILNVAEYALGKILGDAIEWVIGKIRDLIGETIEAASQFQTLQLRLQRLNFNDVVDSAANYGDAMQTATELTKEQMTWLQKLAVTTPYDAQDIANVFTLARSYGFASEEAKGLTQDISNFAAGMGLGNTEIERIIVNFGQMAQQGKVTQREMNDLARGAFVPVNDVLEIMQKKTGLTGAAFDNFRNSGEGVNAFMAAFSQLVATRFQGAAEGMARTFQGATANAADLLKSLVGFNVVTPILDVVGGKIADFISSITSMGEGPDTAMAGGLDVTPALGSWERLTGAAGRFGEALSGLVSDMLGLLPSTEGLVDKIVLGLEGMTNWIKDNKEKIIGFFTNIGDTITNDVIPFVRDQLLPALADIGTWVLEHKGEILDFFTNIGDTIANSIVPFIENNLVPAFDKISAWVSENGDTIKEFFTTLGEIAGGVIEDLTGADFSSGGLESLLKNLSKFMDYVIKNKDEIQKFIDKLAKLFAIFTVVGFILGIIMGIFIAILTPIIALIGFVTGLIAIFTTLTSPLGLVIVGFLLLAAGIAWLWSNIGEDFTRGVEYTKEQITTWWTDLWTNFQIGIDYTKEQITTWWTDLWANFQIGIDYTKEQITTWWTDLWANFQIGIDYTKEQITTWWTDLWANFQTGIDYIKEQITTWWTDLGTGFTTGTSNLKNTIATWVTDMGTQFSEFSTTLIQSVTDGFVKTVATVKEKVDYIKSYFMERNWKAVGAYIIQGVTAGIVQAATQMVQAVINAVVAAYDAAMNAAQAHSPSKLFMKIGKYMMQGMGEGISDSVDLAVREMQGAVMAIAAPAMNLPALTQQYSVAAAGSVNHTNNYTNNWNLTVNSNAPQEPILQDYNMMKSLAGA